MRQAKARTDLPADLAALENFLAEREKSFRDLLKQAQDELRFMREVRGELLAEIIALRTQGEEKDRILAALQASMHGAVDAAIESHRHMAEELQTFYAERPAPGPREPEGTAATLPQDVQQGIADALKAEFPEDDTMPVVVRAGPASEAERMAANG